jgi:chromosomal replication initiation ATPase DnaA
MAYKNPTQEAVITAACQHFEITETDLLNITAYNVSYMRHICFYLIKENTLLSKSAIGFRFGKTKSPVNYGIDIIGCTKNNYSQTLADLKEIAKKAGISKY